MDNSGYENFGEYFRQEILPKLIGRIEPALNRLRQSDPQEWYRIAMELQRRQSYQRIEEIREVEDELEALILSIADGLRESIPEFVRQEMMAVERHYVQHGQELDDLIRSSPAAESMNAKESVDAMLRTMGFNMNPSDPR